MNGPPSSNTRSSQAKRLQLPSTVPTPTRLRSNKVTSKPISPLPSPSPLRKNVQLDTSQHPSSQIVPDPFTVPNNRPTLTFLKVPTKDQQTDHTDVFRTPRNPTVSRQRQNKVQDQSAASKEAQRVNAAEEEPKHPGSFASSNKTNNLKPRILAADPDNSDSDADIRSQSNRSILLEGGDSTTARPSAAALPIIVPTNSNSSSNSKSSLNVNVYVNVNITMNSNSERTLPIHLILDPVRIEIVHCPPAVVPLNHTPHPFTGISSSEPLPSATPPTLTSIPDSSGNTSPLHSPVPPAPAPVLAPASASTSSRSVLQSSSTPIRAQRVRRRLQNNVLAIILGSCEILRQVHIGFWIGLWVWWWGWQTA